MQHKEQLALLLMENYLNITVWLINEGQIALKRAVGLWMPALGRHWRQDLSFIKNRPSKIEYFSSKPFRWSAYLETSKTTIALRVNLFTPF